MAQGLDIELFAAQTLGGTYGNPEPTLLRNRGTYQGQCVSFERQRLSAIDGVNWGAVGDAVSYANAANQARYKSIGYTWKPGDTSFKEGDVLVWGDDSGSWTGKEGHISTWFNGKLLNQNFGGSLKVTQNNFFPAGYLGRYTKERGTEMPLTAQQQDKLLKMGLMREPTQAELNNPTWASNPGLLIDTVWNNGGGINYQATKTPFFSNADVDNVLKDIGITPTQADYDAVKKGPKEFAYYLQARIKASVGASQYVLFDKPVYTKR